MTFASDNWAPASDVVIAAVADAARRGGPAYGSDELTKAMTARIAEVFEREVAVFPVATGTAANALAVSAYAKPGGIVFAHAEAHIAEDEAGATEYLAGMKVLGLAGDGGKFTPGRLGTALAAVPDGATHRGRPAVVSLTNLTEVGATYRPDEVRAIAEVARTRGCAMHMDGARFANAVAALGCTPADLTWRAGVDVLSFGGTKNGCIAADAVVFFDLSGARDFAFLRQRSGHAFSKQWFVAAQFDAYLADGHWLDLARHANAMGARLAKAMRKSGKGRLAIAPAANEVFAVLPRALDAHLRKAGAVYYEWPAVAALGSEGPSAGEVLVRLVASFATSEADVDAFANALNAFGGPLAERRGGRTR
jgi:threonine aldolase